jgi:hypothetical protein
MKVFKIEQTRFNSLLVIQMVRPPDTRAVYLGDIY